LSLAATLSVLLENSARRPGLCIFIISGWNLYFHKK
jgi:hypothetical protein